MTNNKLPHKFTTRDGRTVSIRTIKKTDTALLVDLWHHMSEHTRRMRFHTLPRDLPPQEIWRRAAELAHLHPRRQAAVVATISAEDGEHIVGVARLSRSTPDAAVAETAVVVRDDFQHVGLGTHLLRTLGDVALAMGIQIWVSGAYGNQPWRNARAARYFVEKYRLKEASPNGGARTFTKGEKEDIRRIRGLEDECATVHRH